MDGIRGFPRFAIDIFNKHAPRVRDTHIYNTHSHIHTHTHTDTSRRETGSPRSRSIVRGGLPHTHTGRYGTLIRTGPT